MENTAFISIREICNTYQLDRGKTVHQLWKTIPLACKAVQELSMMTLPIVHHIIINKEPNAPYFKIPEGFVDWVSVSMRVGNRYVPVPVSNNLIPFLPQNCKPNPFSSSFGGSFKHGGDWKSWLNKECEYEGADFFADDFFDDDFSQNNGVISEGGNCITKDFAYGGFFPFWGNFGVNTQGEFIKGGFTYMSRPDEVAFNIPKKMIVVPDGFPSECLYLVFIGKVEASSMTRVPLTAQACIEAYIDWKMALKKRDNLSSAREYERLYNDQHRLLRARLSTITTTSIYRLINKGYVTARNRFGIGDGTSANGSGGGNTTVIYQKKQAIIVYADTDGNVVTNYLLVGTTTSEVAFIIVNGLSINSGFYLDPIAGQLVFTDGTYLSIGDKITVYYA